MTLLLLLRNDPPPVFSKFSEPTVKKVQQTPQSFVFLPPVVAVTIKFGGGGEWIDYLPKVKPQEGFVTSTPRPTAVVVPPVFTGFTDFGIPTPHRVAAQDISSTTLPQVVVVQPYIFSQFEQPQFKNKIYDQPTWFGSVAVYQPYVFSSFSQPQLTRFPILQQPVQRGLQQFAIVTPPVFTGFSDFGLTQQLIGTQRKQDGSYSQFTVLPLPQIISPLVFFGFSDFGVKISGNKSKITNINDVVFTILPEPPFIILTPVVGGKRTPPQQIKKGHEHEPHKPKTIPLKSSNIASMAYDVEQKELTLTFKTYKYEDVSSKKAKALLNADSHGKYFHKYIKNSHPTIRMK